MIRHFIAHGNSTCVHDLRTDILYNLCYLQVKNVAGIIAKNQITEGGPVILVQVSSLLYCAHHIERARCRLKMNITTVVSCHALADVLEANADFLQLVKMSTLLSCRTPSVMLVSCVISSPSKIVSYIRSGDSIT